MCGMQDTKKDFIIILTIYLLGDKAK